ncbi:MAG: SIS domain-containing protein [Actinobacteria bacterium]|nr:MAG: SIS domain-containing protein [Actinomycetota bacterium]
MKSLGNFPDPFIAEIAGQPEALRRAGNGAIEQAEALEAAVAPARRGHIVLSGMGSSYDACYPAVTTLAALGVPTLMLDAAELLHFRLPILQDEDLLVLVSQSGESAETVGVARALRGAGRSTTIACVTNGVGNTLASLADVALDTRAGEETGPSTMTFVCALALLGALARTIAGATAHDAASSIAREAGRTAEAVAALVADRALPDRLVSWHGGRATTVILGRGAARAAAEMGALTIKEAAGMPVESLQAAQFRHGPLELAGPDLAAIVLATEPETAELDRDLAADLAKLGAAVLLVTTVTPAPSDTLSIAIGSLDRLLSPAAAVVPAQLLAWRLSVTSGRIPGSYVHASKVTTRE